MTETPPALPSKPETFGLLRAFLILVSLYNVFNITGLIAYLEHQVFVLIGLTKALGPTALPLVLLSFVALIVQSVFLCRFNEASRRIQTGISSLAPFVRVWGILEVRQLHPERITTAIWIGLVLAIIFDLIVVLVTNTQKAKRATRQLR